MWSSETLSSTENREVKHRPAALPSCPAQLPSPAAQPSRPAQPSQPSPAQCPALGDFHPIEPIAPVQCPAYQQWLEASQVVRIHPIAISLLCLCSGSSGGHATSPRLGYKKSTRRGQIWSATHGLPSNPVLDKMNFTVASEGSPRLS